jgi:hypothetical protein
MGYFRICVFSTQHILFSPCTKFNQNRMINGRHIALRWYMQLEHIKMGQESSFLGQNTQFGGGGLSFLSAGPVPTCRMLSFDMHIV